MTPILFHKIVLEALLDPHTFIVASVLTYFACFLSL